MKNDKTQLQNELTYLNQETQGLKYRLDEREL